MGLGALDGVAEKRKHWQSCCSVQLTPPIISIADREKKTKMAGLQGHSGVKAGSERLEEERGTKAMWRGGVGRGQVE